MNISSFSKIFLIPSILAAAFVAGQESQFSPVTSNSMVLWDQQECGENFCCRDSFNGTSDYIVSASFIYWQPIQENMELGVVSNTTHSDFLVHGKDVKMDFDYKPGFKIGLGKKLGCDGWSTFVEYTWFRGEQHVRRNLNPNNQNHVLLPAWVIPNLLNPQYNFGSEKWTLEMNFIDWDFARAINVGTHFCLTPFFGLRAAFIDQHLHVKYINENASQAFIFPSTFITQKSNSWGVGPRIGLAANWCFCEGFRLFGDGEFDLLYTQYDLKTNQFSKQEFANGYLIHQKDVYFLRAHAELNLGIGWRTCFCGGYYVDFSAAYNVQVFFDQNMFRSIANAQAAGKSTLPDGNLYMHGLTATLRVDF